MSTYCLAAKKFSWNKTKNPYEGYVVFGEERLFFIVTRAVSGAAISVGSALGGVVGGAIGSKMSASDDPIARRLKPLHEEVLSAPGWPVPKEITTALQFDREQISRVTYPWWGGLSVTQKTCIYYVQAGFSSRKRIVEFLRAHGWMGKKKGN